MSPRTDVVVDLEDLKVVQRGPQRHLNGPNVSPAAIARLCGTAAPWPSDAWEEVPEQARIELVNAGWFTASGDLGSRGAELRDGLGAQRTLLTLTAAGGDGSRRGWVVAGAELAVTIIDESPAGAGPVEQLSFQTGPASALPIVLAKWGALNPAWNYDAAHELIDAKLIEQRVRDSSTPAPDGADEELRWLWQQEWTQWGVVAPQLGVELEFLTIAGHGHYVVRTRQDGVTVLAPRPSSLLWGDVQSILAALPGRTDPDAAEDW